MQLLFLGLPLAWMDRKDSQSKTHSGLHGGPDKVVPGHPVVHGEANLRFAAFPDVDLFIEGIEQGVDVARTIVPSVHESRITHARGRAQALTQLRGCGSLWHA